MDLSWYCGCFFSSSAGVLDENNTIMCRTDVAWM